MEWLDNFLFERVGEETDTEGKNEGILFISELDGFLTAIVSGPETVPMSVWLPVVWGDFIPECETDEKMMEVVSLIVRHMNNIVSLLMEQPEDFHPLYLQRVVKGEMYLIVDEWCEGYMLGVELSQDAWYLDDPSMKEAFMPIQAFVGDAAYLSHKKELTELRALQDQITLSARKIHANWLAFRSAEVMPASFEKPVVKVGRNDPCFCGSGKKFKKCCLH